MTFKLYGGPNDGDEIEIPSEQLPVGKLWRIPLPGRHPTFLDKALAQEVENLFQCSFETATYEHRTPGKLYYLH
jgi:hypothetical protein